MSEHDPTPEQPAPNQAPQRRFFSAVTLDRAVMAAASHYGLDPAELAYKPVEKRGLARGKVAIRVDPDNLQAPSPSPQAVVDPPASRDSEASLGVGRPSDSESLGGPGPQADRPPKAARARDSASEERRPVAGGPKDRPRRAGRHSQETPGKETSGQEAHSQEPHSRESGRGHGSKPPAAAGPKRGGLQELPASPASLRPSRRRADRSTTEVAEEQLGLLLDLAGLNLDAEVFEGEEGLEIELGGSDADLAIEDEGQVLRAMEHLLPRLMQPGLGKIVPCRVDCENFQLLREERLRTKAQRAAESVRRNAQSEILEPMHPADRRIVHLALVADESVTTESVGRGYFRRVSIRPA